MCLLVLVLAGSGQALAQPPHAAEQFPIVNGDIVASAADFPWIAALVSRSSSSLPSARQFCGGTLIDGSGPEDTVGDYLWGV